MWTPDDSLRTALTFCVWYCFNLALCCQRHRSIKSKGEPVGVFPQTTSLSAVSFLKVQERTVDASAWFGSAEGFGTGLRVLTSICLRLVLVIPRSSVEPARHSRLHTHIHLPAFLSIIVLDILPYWYFATLCLSTHCFSQLLFAKVYCVLEIQMSFLCFFVTFLCLFVFFFYFYFFYTNIYCLFYSLR